MHSPTYVCPFSSLYPPIHDMFHEGNVMPSNIKFLNILVRSSNVAVTPALSLDAVLKIILGWGLGLKITVIAPSIAHD